MCRVEGFSGACGAVGSDGSVDDTDGDGVTDDRDNCKDTANANQANEDGDALGDVCDPCPITGDPAGDTDTDGDGVGDGCDPRPDTMSASIALFEGFADAAIPMRASPVPTSGWTFAGDGSAIGASAQDVASILGWNNAAPSQTIRAQLTVTTVENTPNRGVGVVMPYDPSTNLGAVCWILGPQLELRAPSGQMPFASAPTTVIEAGKSYRFTLTRKDNAFDCREQSVSGIAAATLPEAVLTGSLTGVFVENLTARFDWILVVNE